MAKRTVCALLMAVALVLTACDGSTTPPANEDRELGGLLGNAARASAQGNDLLVLVEVARIPWERAVVFGPYADSTEAERVLGFPWDLSAASPWVNSEGGHVLVLADSMGVVSWTTVPSGEVDMYCIAGVVFGRDDAVFESEGDDTSTPVLMLPDDEACR
ncbi:MAG: hypothetical protein AB1627_05665 [Chloroflexota bacterium]